MASGASRNQSHEKASKTAFRGKTKRPFKEKRGKTRHRDDKTPDGGTLLFLFCGIPQGTSSERLISFLCPR